MAARASTGRKVQPLSLSAGSAAFEFGVDQVELAADLACDSRP